MCSDSERGQVRMTSKMSSKYEFLIAIAQQILLKPGPDYRVFVYSLIGAGRVF